MFHPRRFVGSLLLAAAMLLSATAASAMPRPDGPGTSVGASNHPRIQWSERRIVRTLAPGASTSVTVTLTSSSDLDGVTLHLSHGLADVVDLSPASPLNLKAGIAVTVTLKLHRAADATGGRAGVVRVQAGTRTVPTTLHLQIKQPGASEDADDDKQHPGKGKGTTPGNGNGHTPGPGNGHGGPNRP